MTTQHAKFSQLKAVLRQEVSNVKGSNDPRSSVATQVTHLIELLEKHPSPSDVQFSEYHSLAMHVLNISLCFLRSFGKEMDKTLFEERAKILAPSLLKIANLVEDVSTTGVSETDLETYASSAKSYYNELTSFGNSEGSNASPIGQVIEEARFNSHEEFLGSSQPEAQSPSSQTANRSMPVGAMNKLSFLSDGRNNTYSGGNFRLVAGDYYAHSTPEISRQRTAPVIPTEYRFLENQQDSKYINANFDAINGNFYGGPPCTNATTHGASPSNSATANHRGQSNSSVISSDCDSPMDM